ncbi:MAG: Mbeg1-like protein [Bacilli bacterium]
MCHKNEKEKIISFKGTDSSLIGWLENFRLAYEYPTYTQKLAIDYLKNNISFLDQDVYVVGHSKGGNLANG